MRKVYRLSQEEPQNSLIIACATNTWEEADDWKTAAEQVYHEAVAKATSKGDKDSLEALKDLREELDALDEFKRKELMGMTTEQFRAALTLSDAEQEVIDKEGEEEMAAWAAFQNGACWGVASDDYDELADAEDEEADPRDSGELAKAENENEDNGFQGADEVARAENANEIAAARILPDRSMRRFVSTPDTTPTTRVPTIVGDPPEAPTTTQTTTASKKFKLSRKKSTLSKGGAYHAHSFNREQAKQASRSSVLDMDWTAENNEAKEQWNGGVME
ncbi:unnamed protein product [Alternaria sp. RS040]